MRPYEIESEFEKRALSGDGAYAIAYAILQLADQQRRVANELNALGTGTTATPDGALGLVATALNGLADSVRGDLSEIATAVEDHA